MSSWKNQELKDLREYFVSFKSRIIVLLLPITQILYYQGRKSSFTFCICKVLQGYAYIFFCGWIGGFFIWNLRVWQQFGNFLRSSQLEKIIRQPIIFLVCIGDQPLVNVLLRAVETP